MTELLIVKPWWLIFNARKWTSFSEPLATLPPKHVWQVWPASHEFTLRWWTGLGSTHRRVRLSGSGSLMLYKRP